MHRIVSYLKFLLDSTNQHGVHSPFVYNFVTKCLYQKTLYGDSKVMDVLMKSLAYFNSNNVFFDGIDSVYLSEVQKRYPAVKLNEVPYDFIYIEKLDESNISTYIIGNKDRSNDTALIVNAIHGNKDVEALWEGLKHSEQIRVTIDLFYCGLVFFREEQAKEHFKIRI